jgi:hypothetical protein
MSTALNQIVDRIGQDTTRSLKILFLTDGRNESESRQALDQAVVRCSRAQASISAWGIGTDWDETELRHLADATHGSADIIPTPQQIGPAFAESFREMRGTSITNARMSLWSPAGVKIKRLEQVYPTLVALGPEPDAANPRKPVVSLGSFAAGDQRDYLLELEVPVYAPGQQFLLVRPSLKYFVGGVNELEEKSTQAGWVFAQWTEDRNLANQIEEHIAHYTHQEELSRDIREGQAALAAGDNEKATRLLAHALEISERTGNEKITRLLSELVQRDAKGTLRLNQQANAVARKTLAINTGRTSKLQ